MDEQCVVSRQEEDHICQSYATKTTFICSTSLLQLSIHLVVVPQIATIWYHYRFYLDFS